MVSRETGDSPAWGPPPRALVDAYPDAVPALERYAALLADDGVVRGLVGPREVPRLWVRHLLNCAVVEQLVPRGATVADVGSGGGLPGLVLALVRPDLRVTLVEPLLRRSVFLQEACARLDRPDVEVVRSRAEELKDRTFDVVTARAVAPLDRLAGWCAPLVRPGGSLLALKGERAVDEVAAAAARLDRLGLVDAEVRTVAVGDSDPTTVVIMRKDARRADAGRPTRRCRR